MRNEAADIVQDHPEEFLSDDLKHKAIAAGTAAWDVTRATYQQLHDKTVEYSRVTDQAIRTNPYMAVGVAFGVGLIFGACLLGSNSSSKPYRKWEKEKLWKHVR